MPFLHQGVPIQQRNLLSATLTREAGRHPIVERSLPPVFSPDLGDALGRTTANAARRSRRGPIMRLIWAVTSLVLTLAMIGVAWVTRARVLQSVRDLDQSQGEVLLTSIRESLRSLPAPPAVPLLDSLLDRHAAGGLTSIAFFGSDDRPIASAGPESGGAAVNLHPSDTTSIPVATAGGRLRMLGFFRPTRDSASVPVWAQRARSPAASEARSVLMIEFDPILARGLLADADRTFALAAVTGTALVAVTLLFWRLAGLYEATQRRNEQAQRLAALGEMSAVLAHEIRNPLASLKGNAQLLARRLTTGSAEAGRRTWW